MANLPGLEVERILECGGLQWLVLVGEQESRYVNDMWIDDIDKDDVQWLVERANTQRLGGFSDWRLPTADEFMTLKGTEFAPPQGAYWTSTDVAGDGLPRFEQTAEARFAAFSDDGSAWLDYDDRYQPHLVRLVRLFNQ